MKKKHSVSINTSIRNLIIQFDVYKTQAELLTEAKAHWVLAGSNNLVMHRVRDFVKVAFTTKVKRFSNKSLKAHTDWIEENKKVIEAEVIKFYENLKV